MARIVTRKRPPRRHSESEDGVQGPFASSVSVYVEDAGRGSRVEPLAVRGDRQGRRVRDRFLAQRSPAQPRVEALKDARRSGRRRGCWTAVGSMTSGPGRAVQRGPGRSAVDALRGPLPSRDRPSTETGDRRRPRMNSGRDPELGPVRPAIDRLVDTTASSVEAIVRDVGDRRIRGIEGDRIQDGGYPESSSGGGPVGASSRRRRVLRKRNPDDVPGQDHRRVGRGDGKCPQPVTRGSFGSQVAPASVLFEIRLPAGKDGLGARRGRSQSIRLRGREVRRASSSLRHPGFGTLPQLRPRTRARVSRGPRRPNGSRPAARVHEPSSCSRRPCSAELRRARRPEAPPGEEGTIVIAGDLQGLLRARPEPQRAPDRQSRLPRKRPSAVRDVDPRGCRGSIRIAALSPPPRSRSTSLRRRRSATRRMTCSHRESPVGTGLIARRLTVNAGRIRRASSSAPSPCS